MSEYKVIRGSVRPQSTGFLGLGPEKDGLTAFEEDVAKHLAEGWKCQGGVSLVIVESGKGSGMFMQAMVR